MRYTIILVILSALILAGCGGTKKTGELGASTKALESIPDWFTNPPVDPNYLFATGTATSIDMQLARDKASTSARNQIAKSIESNFKGLSKRFQEEVGTEENAQYLDMFTQAISEVTSQVLHGVSIDKADFQKEGNRFRAYVLAKMPLGATNQALLNKLKQQEEMYTRFRATQAFQELEEQTEKFERWKNQDEGGQLD